MTGSSSFAETMKLVLSDTKYTGGAKVDRLRHSRGNDGFRRVIGNAGEDPYTRVAVCNVRPNKPSFDDRIIRNRNERAIRGGSSAPKASRCSQVLQ